MNIKGMTAALLAGISLFSSATVMAASYNRDNNSVSADEEGSYQTVLVTNMSEDTFYYMDTVQTGLSTVMNLSLIGNGLEDGSYILRLKPMDGDAQNQFFTVGTPSVPEEAKPATYVGDGNKKVVEGIETVSKGYYIDGTFGGEMTVYVSFTYEGKSYVYSEKWNTPIISGGAIGIQINDVPVSVTDMSVNIL